MRRGRSTLAFAAAIVGSAGSLPADITPPVAPPLNIPKAAGGNGYRGSGGNAYHEPRSKKARHRKLAKASKRRNRK